MRLRVIGSICLALLAALANGCGGNGGKATPAILSVTTPPPSGTVNVAYNATLMATGGKAPYSWSVVSGSLPKGLSLTSSGTISGTPTLAGSTPVTIQVSDSASTPGTGTLATTIAISDGTVAITTTSPLPEGVLNTAYSTALTASGGSLPYTWSVASGSLPTGITLSTAGILSGTPSAYGTYSFTAQATDAASPAQSATAPLLLKVSGGTLAITTAALPGGVQGVPYSSQISAAGGVPPYAWTMTPAAPLPGGVTLSTSGLLAGTPLGPSDSSPLFTLTDNDGHTASQNLSLLVQPAPGTIADGHYAFVFGGTAPQGASVAANAIAINGTFTFSNGVVLSGFYDANTNSGPAQIEQPISGGSLTPYADGLGYLVLQTAAGKMTFSLAIPASSAPGKESAIRIIEFDDVTGTGSRGSGVLKPALPNPSTATLGGNFAFLLSGSDPDQNEQALIGSFQTDGAGDITGGLADSNQAGAVFAFPRVNGSYSVDANGRGVFQFVLGAGPINENTFFHYSFYQVSPGEWLTISLDPATYNSPLVGGSVLQQEAGPFNLASLSGVSVLELSGLLPTSGGHVPDITLGLATSDGDGALSLNFDEYNGTLLPTQNQSWTYTVDPVTGRVATSSSTDGPRLYLIDANRAWVVDADLSASSGLLERQSGSPFTTASFKGEYLGGSLPLIDTDGLNEAGILAADGTGSLLLTTNRSTSQGLALYQNIAGTYTVDGTGRVVATTPDGVARLFYVVSPTSAAYLTSDGGGYLGSFAQ